jgi:hypothetical protein
MLACQSAPKLLISDPGSVCEMPSAHEDGLCAGPRSTRELSHDSGSRHANTRQTRENTACQETSSSD